MRFSLSLFLSRSLFLSAMWDSAWRVHCHSFVDYKCSAEKFSKFTFVDYKFSAVFFLHSKFSSGLTFEKLIEKLQFLNELWEFLSDLWWTPLVFLNGISQWNFSVEFLNDLWDAPLRKSVENYYWEIPLRNCTVSPVVRERVSLTRFSATHFRVTLKKIFFERVFLKESLWHALKRVNATLSKRLKETLLREFLLSRSERL